MEKLFTIEFDKENEKLEMHLNEIGISQLIDLLKQLQQNKTDDHCHLMSENWGGKELSAEPQNIENNILLINHLKIFYWSENK